MKTLTVSGVGEYLEIVEKTAGDFNIVPNTVHSKSIWFRGQKSAWPLLPSAFRDRSDEYHVLTVFRSVYKNYTPERFDDRIVELFSFMQHYGIPTRLLDWTESPLVALFFAIEEAKNGDSPVVFALHSPSLNSSTLPGLIHPIIDPEIDVVTARMDMVPYLEKANTKPTEVSDFFFVEHPEYEKFKADKKQLAYPIAFYPATAGNPRSISQKSTFTIHGLLQDPIEDIMDTANNGDFLVKIQIESSAIEKVSAQLGLFGISYRSIYPDLYGLAQELRGGTYKWRSLV